MLISEWRTRDISFFPHERKKVTIMVNRLLNNGWHFHEGEICEDLVNGDLSIDGTMEEIQLNKKFSFKVEK